MACAAIIGAAGRIHLCLSTQTARKRPPPQRRLLGRNEPATEYPSGRPPGGGAGTPGSEPEARGHAAGCCSKPPASCRERASSSTTAGKSPCSPASYPPRFPVSQPAAPGPRYAPHHGIPVPSTPAVTGSERRTQVSASVRTGHRPLERCFVRLMPLAAGRCGSYLVVNTPFGVLLIVASARWSSRLEIGLVSRSFAQNARQAQLRNARTALEFFAGRPNDPAVFFEAYWPVLWNWCSERRSCDSRHRKEPNACRRCGTPRPT